MLRFHLCLVLLSACLQALGEERVIDFARYPLDQAPAGFTSALTGQGKIGDWKVIHGPHPPSPSPATTNQPTANRVLAQLSQDGTDERFPLLILDDASYSDFELTTQFKMVDGLIEQMAGLAFRIQDTNNYYYVRASALGNSFRFIKLVNGQRLTTVGPSLEISKDVWHELKIICKGNRIDCLLDGKELIPALTDNTFTSGRIGFWTKSDAISYFGTTRLVYTPHEILASILIRDAIKRYPRLIGLKLYSAQDRAEPRIIASTHPDEIGEAGGKVEADVIQRGVLYYGKENKFALVTLPLHDHNGEVAAAVRVVLESFPGQTEQNAVARAQPVVKEMEKRVRTAKDLLQ